MLTKIRPPGSDIDHLFVGTINFQYFTAVFNPHTLRFDTVHYFEDLTAQHLGDSESRDTCVVDPTGRFLALGLFEGVVNFIKVVKPRKAKQEYLDKPEQIRITEIKVFASTFLHTETKQPKIAFLYQDGKGGEMRLATYRITDDKDQYSTFQKKDRENDINNICPGASHLIPVPKPEGGAKRHAVRNAAVQKAHLGGVIIVGETRITYLDDESGVVIDHTLDVAALFVACVALDGVNFLLSDDYGGLHLLEILMSGDEITGMHLRLLGNFSSATNMIYLGEGDVFIASHGANCQIVHIDLNSSPPVTVVQEFDNIAPILDFAVMDLGGRDGDSQMNEYSSGQARLVTASGVFQGGSLRSVRSGVGTEDVGQLCEVNDVLRLFPLRKENTLDDILVFVTPVETRIFSFDCSGDVEELEDYKGMATDQPTLVAIDLPNEAILQVTPTAVTILGAGRYGFHAQWEVPAGSVITEASANSNHVLISVNGISLVSLDILDGLKVVATRPVDNDQVSCIHVSSQFPGIGIVGFWQSGFISILNLKTLEPIHSEPLARQNNDTVPRNIALAQLLPKPAGPTLCIAMDDGVILTFNIHKSKYTLTNRKSIVLGTQHATFHILPRVGQDTSNIFAVCEHPSLIHYSEGRIKYSAVTIDSATCVCPFNSALYPSSIIVASSTALKISTIDSQQQTHVRTLHIGKTVRRLCYSTAERAFAVCLLDRQLVDAVEIVTSTFQLVEEINFTPMGKPYPISVPDSAVDDEELIECVASALLPTAHGEHAPLERFMVGTSFVYKDAEGTSDRGRILIFGIDAERSPYLITSLTVRGNCRKLTILDGKILAALNKTVVLYSYNETTTHSATLTKLATYRTSTVPVDLTITPDSNIIAVADMMKSLSLVRYTPGINGLPDTLSEIARHHEAIWATAMCFLEGDSYLESDHDGNLIILRRNIDGVTESDKKKMEVTGEFGLGDQVNRIQRIDVKPSANAVVVPKAFLGTVSLLLPSLPSLPSYILTTSKTEGAIHLFCHIVPTSTDLLYALQRRLATHPSITAVTLGGIPFNSYRNFKNSERESEEPFRFIDGELIDRFLDLTGEEQDDLSKGIGGASVVREVVEELRRLF